MPVIAPTDFGAELTRLDLLLHREILRLRASYQLSLDELRGLYISDEQVDALVVSQAAGAPGEGGDPAAALTAEAESLAAELGDASPLGRLARDFGLTRFERDAVLLAAAPELDLKYDTLYAYLNNNVARRRPTVELALRLFGRGDPAARASLHGSGRLFREALLEPTDPPSEARSELGAAFTIAPALAAWLLGLPVADPRLRGHVDLVPVAGPLLGAASLAALDRAARALATLSKGAGGEAPLTLLECAVGQAPIAAASHLLRSLQRSTLRLDGAAPLGERSFPAALALVARLSSAGLFVDGEEWTAEPALRQLAALLRHLSRAGVPIVLALAPAQPWRGPALGLQSLRVALEAPNTAERYELWAAALDLAGIEAEREAVAAVVERFRLGPTQIAAAARGLASDGCDESGRATAGRLLAAARAESQGELHRLAARMPQRHVWDDLVLPPVIARRLRDVVGAIGARGTVFGAWGFGARSGSGLMALFSGASGTGKTMSAQVIARDLGLDLHRIDLASVVSKYIGETEKNLARIFEAAAASNAILFFDEADALLGKRSEVKDAHDRYANIEVAYLLQRMEEHDGVVILATNLSKNIDAAFARRMHYTIEFPRPDAPLRERLWSGVFPRAAPLDGDVDFAFLARRFELTGGDIKTIALDAAFAAAGQGRAIAMADLVAAVSRQLVKQGRPVAASDFKQFRASQAGPGAGTTSAGATEPACELHGAVEEPS